MPHKNSPFLVIIHDVAPRFRGDLEVIQQMLDSQIGCRFSCAVVPRWHGKEISVNEMPEMVATCHEVLLHGWTHQRDCPRGIVSLLTNQSDEFGGLKPEEIQARINIARTELVNLTGREIKGLVPPAWQLPMPSKNIPGLSYVMRYGRLESCDDAQNFQNLATWSFDWGWMTPAAWGGVVAGNAKWKLCANTIPCIVIHPIDVARGWLPRIRRLIEHFINLGLHPVVPDDIHQSFLITDFAKDEANTQL